MKAQLIKENINPLFKPKSEEEINKKIVQRDKEIDDFMNNIFKNLYKKTKNSKIYYNINNEPMFIIKKQYLYVDYYMIWHIIESKWHFSYLQTSIFIQNWIKQNTDWPDLIPTPVFNNTNYESTIS